MEESLNLDDGYLRCQKCKVEGGTILSKVTISIQRDGPYLPIAGMIRCRCGWVGRVNLLPGHRDPATGRPDPSNAELAGVSLRQVAECVRQSPLTGYTVEELKSGEVSGAAVKAAAAHHKEGPGAGHGCRVLEENTGGA